MNNGNYVRIQNAVVFLIAVMMAPFLFAGADKSLLEQQKMVHKQIDVSNLYIFKLLYYVKTNIEFRLKDELAHTGQGTDYVNELAAQAKLVDNSISLFSQIVEALNKNYLSNNTLLESNFIKTCDFLNNVPLDEIAPHNLRAQLRAVKEFDQFISMYGLDTKNILKPQDVELFNKITALNQSLMLHVFKKDNFNIGFTDTLFDYMVYQPIEFVSNHKLLSAVILLIVGVVSCLCAYPQKSASSVQKKYSQRRSFIEDIVGMSEERFKEQLRNDNFENIAIHRGANGLVLTTPRGTFNCGNFEQLSIGDLQQLAQEKPRNQQAKAGTFSIIARRPNYADRSVVDVATLQAMPENRDAVFQVASNFNCLEAVDANQNIEEQLLTSYIYDMTQGPFASISAAPGTILRRYFLFYDQAKTASMWGQSRQGQNRINLLSDVAEKIHVTPAGYVQFNNNSVRPNNVDDYRRIKIGFHGGVQVTFGGMSDRNSHAIVADKNQLINQVFTAAINFASADNRPYRQQPMGQSWAVNILNAAYEGTLLSAYVKNKNKVFLTLIGGGVFNNNMHLIVNAIARQGDFIRRSGLDVILVCYQMDQNLEQALQPLFQLSEQAQGANTIYE